MAILLASYVRSRVAAAPASAIPVTPATSIAPTAAQPLSMRSVLHEAFTDSAHLLLLGGVLIGFLTGDSGKQVMKPFTDLQKGASSPRI